MIDLKQWIYSGDMAAWFSRKGSFSVEAQMECICCAPHRTLGEKLEGLRQLQDESGAEIVSGRIKALDFLHRQSRQDVPEENSLFQAEIFYQGDREPGLPMIFRTARQAADEIKLWIEELSAECELGREQYHGIIKMYRKEDSTGRFFHEKNLVVRHDGAALFALNPCYRKQVQLPGSGNRQYGERSGDSFPYWEITWEIPYPSGTIVTVDKNPFFPSTKGVLVNLIEPDEADFAGDRYNQWLLCAAHAYTEQTHGMDVINLLDDYVPFPCSVELPYKQYISAYKGKLEDKETWLAELSDLIQSDKSCIRIILRDRRPDVRYRREHDKKRLAYVRGLAAKENAEQGESNKERTGGESHGHSKK